MLEWSRWVDPVTRQGVRFGFCRFEAPAGALAALRLVHGLQWGEQGEFVVYVDSDTKSMLDKFVEDLRDPIKMMGSDRTLSGLTENDEMKKVVMKKLIAQQKNSMGQP